MVVVKFWYEGNDDLMGGRIQLTNCKPCVHFKMLDTVIKDIIPVLIKSVVFFDVGLSYLIKNKGQIYFNVDEI